jgi:hypothetical protein
VNGWSAGERAPLAAISLSWRASTGRSSPDTATADDVRRFQLHLVEAGLSDTAKAIEDALETIAEGEGAQSETMPKLSGHLENAGGDMRWLKVTAIVKRGADPATEEEVLVNSDHIISIAGDTNGCHIYVNGPSNPIVVKQKLQSFEAVFGTEMNKVI